MSPEQSNRSGGLFRMHPEEAGGVPARRCGVVPQLSEEPAGVADKLLPAIWADHRRVRHLLQASQPVSPDLRKAVAEPGSGRPRCNRCPVGGWLAATVPVVPVVPVL